MLVGSEACEDRYLVDLQLLQPHEEVVDVTVLPLHDHLRDDSWELLLLGREQSSHGE